MFVAVVSRGYLSESQMSVFGQADHFAKFALRVLNDVKSYKRSCVPIRKKCCGL